MTLRLVDANTTAPQPWRNGGGQTRELMVWPLLGAWRLRISRADIAQDGPFSAFPGVQRWFTVLQGAGVALRFADGEQILRTGDAPCHFDGALAPGCRLLDGPTQDLNLMARHGSATMQPWQPGVPGPRGHAMRGLYTTVAGRWHAGTRQHVLHADQLLWVDDTDTDTDNADDWHFDAQAPGTSQGACWLGFTPED